MKKKFSVSTALATFKCSRPGVGKATGRASTEQAPWPQEALPAWWLEHGGLWAERPSSQGPQAWALPSLRVYEEAAVTQQVWGPETACAYAPWWCCWSEDHAEHRKRAPLWHPGWWLQITSPRELGICGAVAAGGRESGGCAALLVSMRTPRENSPENDPSEVLSLINFKQTQQRDTMIHAGNSKLMHIFTNCQ